MLPMTSDQRFRLQLRVWHAVLSLLLFIAQAVIRAGNAPVDVWRDFKAEESEFREIREILRAMREEAEA